MKKCNCSTCDPNWLPEYTAWKESCDRWIKEHNLDKNAMMFIRTPDHLLRLPCIKERINHEQDIV